MAVLVKPRPAPAFVNQQTRGRRRVRLRFAVGRPGSKMNYEFSKRLRTASSASSSAESLNYGRPPPSTASSWTSETSGSPKRNAERVYGDRFIPSRSETDLATAFALRQVAEPLPSSGRSYGKRKAPEKSQETESLKCKDQTAFTDGLFAQTLTALPVCGCF